MEKEIFEQPETIAQTMQGRVKITPLSPMKYAVPGIDPYLMPRVRMGGLVDHVSVRAARRRLCIGSGGRASQRMGPRFLSEVPSLLRWFLPAPAHRTTDYSPLPPHDVHRLRHQLPRCHGVPPDHGGAD